MIELVNLYGVPYLALFLFTFGLMIAAPSNQGLLRDLVICIVCALLWPLTLPVWIGTAARSCLEKYIDA